MRWHICVYALDLSVGNPGVDNLMTLRSGDGEGIDLNVVGFCDFNKFGFVWLIRHSYIQTGILSVLTIFSR